MRFLFASLPLVALACGGSIGPIDPSTLHVEGSYDLVVSNIVGQPSPNPYQPPDSGHPGIGQHARLDIRKIGSSYDAAVTPENGDPVAMTVTFESDGTMTLVGEYPVGSSGGSEYSTSDEIDALHLAVGADGRFSGGFTAEGQTNVSEGDVGWQSDNTATGTVGADARPPTAQVSALGSAQSVLLPWDELYVHTSEPVDAAALGSALSLTPGAASFQVSSPSVDWIGATSAVGYRTIWSDFSGQASLGVAGGLVDPSGNASAAATSAVQFLSVPSAATFGGASPPAMWGAATIATSSESCGTAASCIEIGPLTGPCGAQPGGIAGRLEAGGATQLSLTFRVRAATQYGPPGWMFDVSAATPGKGAQVLTGELTMPPMNATTDATYPYASDWTTATVALPDTGPEVGFSLVPFQTAQSYCGGGPAFPPVTMLVDVAEITTVP